MFHTAKARAYARRRGKDRVIIVSGCIEPLAILSSQGELDKAGAIILADFDIQCLRGSLSDNDIKALFDVRSGGSIEVKRWHTITFPPRLPRLFSLNGDVQAWMGIFGTGSQHETAKMRRIAIAGYTTPFADALRLIRPSALKHLASIEAQEAEAELAAEREW